MSRLHRRRPTGPSDSSVKLAQVSAVDERKLAVALDRLADEDELHDASHLIISALRTDRTMVPLSPVEVVRIDWGFQIDPMIAPPAAASALAGVKVPADEDGRAYITVRGFVLMGDGSNDTWFTALIECDAQGVLTVQNEDGKLFFSRTD